MSQYDKAYELLYYFLVYIAAGALQIPKIFVRQPAHLISIIQ